LHFVKEALTPAKAVQWLFNVDCLNWEDMKSILLTYLVTNFQKVRETEAWDDILNKMGQEVPPVVREHQMTILREIMAQLPL